MSVKEENKRFSPQVVLGIYFENGAPTFALFGSLPALHGKLFSRDGRHTVVLLTFSGKILTNGILDYVKCLKSLLHSHKVEF